MSDEILEVRNSAFKVTPLIPNPWSATSMSGGVIIISLITLAASIMINSNTQVAYGLGTQFTPGTYPYTGLEPNTFWRISNRREDHRFIACHHKMLVLYYLDFRLVLPSNYFQLITGCDLLSLF